MTNLNMVAFAGHLGRDPEFRNTQSGTAICQFRLGIHQSPSQGKEMETMWFTVKCFGKQAEYASENLRKGDGVEVTGRMTFETWQKQDGTKGSANVVVADHVYKDRVSGQTDQPRTQPAAPAARPQTRQANGVPRVPTAPAPAPAAAVDDLDDTVPF